VAELVSRLPCGESGCVHKCGNRLAVIKLCFTPTNASWANPTEAQFGSLRSFVMGASN